MGFLEDVVDFFTNKVEISDNVKKEERKLFNQLEEMNKSYNERQKSNFIERKMKDYEESPNFERMTYSGPNDSEIAELADSAANEYYQKGLDSLEESIKSDKKALEDKKVLYSQDKDNKLSNLNDSYLASKEKIENDAIKRGLGRSSIVGERLENLELKKMENESAVNNDYNDKITDLDIKINDLENQRDSAIKELDLKTAVVLSDKLKELKNEKQKKEQEILKYNNSVQEKENSYNAVRNKTLNKYLEEYEDIALGKVNDEEYSRERNKEMLNRYTQAYDFYKLYPTNMAKQMIKNNSNILKGYLGSKYYETLLEDF